VPPALVATAIVVPRTVPHAGVLSLGLGWAAPLFIYIANSIGWSLPAYMWMTACGAPCHDVVDSAALFVASAHGQVSLHSSARCCEACPPARR
jgi:hypothetical protein